MEAVGSYARRMTYDDANFIRRTVRPRLRVKRGELVVVDLFSGCGGLTTGLWEAARRAHLGLRVPLAVDVNPVIAATFKRNFPSAGVISSDVADLFPGDPGDPLSAVERRVAVATGPVQLLCGGPPCQGHSDLNNHTRRCDDRNRLYLRMARAAEVLEPEVLLVENVPAVQWDQEDVVKETWTQLEKLGYQVEARVLDLSLLGIPQHRHRHMLVATSMSGPSPAQVFAHIEAFDSERTVRWAIEDLLHVEADGRVFDMASTPTLTNQHRMRFLFDNDLDDLPDSERPPCHRDKPHTYRSVYGRMRWDNAAPTITTGFGSMGQGRFVHPAERRTITPHEAARLQTFPDWFAWGNGTRRTGLATMIGNAVPPVLSLRFGEFLIPYLRSE